MTYEAYMIIFYAGAVLSAILFVVAVALFFVLRIVSVIGDLTGATARKAIRDIREQNELTGDKAYKSSPVNQKRGMLTDKITQSGRLVPKRENITGVSVGTEKIAFTGGDTTVLNTVEMEGETTVLDATAPANSETTMLDASMYGGETTILGGPAVNIVNEPVVSSTVTAQKAANVIPGFSLETDITFINTDERID